MTTSISDGHADADAGVLTSDAGFVMRIRAPEGARAFQVTVKRSR